MCFSATPPPAVFSKRWEPGGHRSAARGHSPWSNAPSRCCQSNSFPEPCRLQDAVSTLAAQIEPAVEPLRRTSSRACMHACIPSHLHANRLSIHCRRAPVVCVFCLRFAVCLWREAQAGDGEAASSWPKIAGRWGSRRQQATLCYGSPHSVSTMPCAPAANSVGIMGCRMITDLCVRSDRSRCDQRVASDRR